MQKDAEALLNEVKKLKTFDQRRERTHAGNIWVEDGTVVFLDEVCNTISKFFAAPVVAPALTFTDATGNTYPLEVGRRYIVMARKIILKHLDELKHLYQEQHTAISPEPFIILLSDVAPNGTFIELQFTDNTNIRLRKERYLLTKEQFDDFIRHRIVLTELSPLTPDEMKILSLLKLGIDATETIK